MKKRTLLCALAALACACSSDNQRDGKIIEVFQRHSYELHPAAGLAAELRAGGPAALKKFDPYAALVGARPEAAAARPAEAPASTGMLLGPCGARVCALRVLRGSPADKAGVKDFDRLISVNGSGQSPEAILPALEGARGAIEIRAERMGRAGEIGFSVEPSAFAYPGVVGLYSPSASAAYVRVPIFYEGAAAVVEKGLASLKRYGFRRVVLDLRYSRGGLPQEAAAVFRLFAPAGSRCFSIKSRHKGYSMEFPGSGGGPYSRLLLSVLVNGETSMASEALAAALAEAGARLYGSRTKGSATIARTFRLDDKGGLRLGVARFFAPSGAEIEGTGVLPSREIPEPAGFKTMWQTPAETLFYRDAAWLAAAKG
jgi:carboxyl-terminal processing protease